VSRVRWLISVLILASQHASRRERTFMKMKNLNLRERQEVSFRTIVGNEENLLKYKQRLGIKQME